MSKKSKIKLKAVHVNVILKYDLLFIIVPQKIMPIFTVCDWHAPIIKARLFLITCTRTRHRDNSSKIVHAVISCLINLWVIFGSSDIYQIIFGVPAN